MTFDLQYLRVFVAAADSGSLGRASALLHLTQPAVSRTIRRLEEQVGAPLFERHSKGMQLTDIGRALLPRAALLLQESELVGEEIRAMLGLARGTVRVGAVGSITCLTLPLAVGALNQRWPQLQVQVVEGVWDRLAMGLVKHEIDLALGVEVEDSDEIVAIKDCRWEDASFIVAASQHPMREKRGLKLSDVSGERWVVPPKGTAPFEHMRRMFAKNGLDLPNVVVETRSITMLKSLVERSNFLSWMPEPMYDAERKAGLIDALRIPGTSERRTLTAFRRRNGTLPAPATKLLEELRRLNVRTCDA